MVDRSPPSQRSKRGVSAVPFFGDLLALARLVRDPDAKLGWKILAVLTLLYVVSPIDAFPEAVAPLIAWVDDVGLVLALRLLLEKRLAPYRYPLFGAGPPRGLTQAAGSPRAEST